jgi:DNA-binding CsgD family transcriptional regulator
METRSAREELFESALDLLGDGIAFLRQDGSIVFANNALRALASHGKDFCIDRNIVRFSAPELRSRLAAALVAIRRRPGARLPTLDFAIERESGFPPCTISVRPLPGQMDERCVGAVAMLMVHDPARNRASNGRILQDLYGLSPAEVHVVQALSTGVSPVDYARDRRVSITTVYTHLKRAREKTGLRSAAELVRRYHELSVALAAGGPGWSARRSAVEPPRSTLRPGSDAD